MGYPSFRHPVRSAYRKTSNLSIEAGKKFPTAILSVGE